MLLVFFSWGVWYSTKSSNRLWIYLSSASYCACLIANGLLNSLKIKWMLDSDFNFLLSLPLAKYWSKAAFPYPVGCDTSAYDSTFEMITSIVLSALKNLSIMFEFKILPVIRLFTGSLSVSRMERKWLHCSTYFSSIYFFSFFRLSVLRTLFM